MYVLQTLHGRLVCFHLFIAFLNPEKVSICRRIAGEISSQILGPK